MHIPKYWFLARQRHATGIRHGITVQKWGWSDVSEADAQEHAKQRVQQAFDAQQQQTQHTHEEGQGEELVRIEHRTEYGLDGEETPIREEIIEQRNTIFMTRNSYGARCLNVENVAIADIDYPNTNSKHRRLFPIFLLLFSLPSIAAILFSDLKFQPAGYALLGFIPLLFIYKLMRWIQSFAQQRCAQSSSTLTPLEQGLAKVYALSEVHPDWGLRIYETPKGLRVIVTHATWSVETPQVQELFKTLDVDPLYSLLCERQKCFRARVSGKPWRMQLPGLSSLDRQWPTPVKYQNSRAQWISVYEKVGDQFAACRLIEHFGSQHLMPKTVQTFIEWHDQESKALTTLPLA